METQKFCLKLEFCVLDTLIKLLMGSGRIITLEPMWGGLLRPTCCSFLGFFALRPQRGSAAERAGLQRRLITAERGHCCGLPCLSASCSSRLNSYTLYRSDQQEERTKHMRPVLNLKNAGSKHR
ncbi:hypothetical protein QQF64_032825 [Cirrhinus molitorella]|uniref:Uncharacterized protein n=1 Tax=Cirrhinus molitorella TaxID=172907 RepID=A0ABR3MS56_9TELE